MLKRSAGILMHITSLPSPYGIGTLGSHAYRFVDFLKISGQKYWQMLPVGPTDGPKSNCPYLAFSVHAGNHNLIDLDSLQSCGLLNKDEYTNINWGTHAEKVDYRKICGLKLPLLKKAYERSKDLEQSEFEKFINKESHWLKNYALYMALKEHFEEPDWRKWPDENIALRRPKSLAHYTSLLKEQTRFFMYTQFLFFNQWQKLKKYAKSRGVFLIGDMPIYVSLQSADTWANPQVFWLDRKKNPVCVGGCPPDQFSSDGQLWNAPLYNWDYLASTDFAWWKDRFETAASMFDVIRIDHFRAFHSYYAIPYPAKNAKHGHWQKGPGMQFFRELKPILAKTRIIAEDLGGSQNKGVKKLLGRTGYPGMKVLQMAFDSSPENENLPHHHCKNSVVYTGTHDNTTIGDWLTNAPPAHLKMAETYAALNKQEGYHWGLIRLAYQSVSKTAIIPMQDFLGLGAQGRMNTPGTIENNWQWRLKSFEDIFDISERIYNLTLIYGRLKSSKNISDKALVKKLKIVSESEYGKELTQLTAKELHNVLGKTVISLISKDWQTSKQKHANSRRAYYFSAEFLIGRMFHNNLYALKILDTTTALLKALGIDINSLEDIPDPALGNGGLGRLAACFLDSAATQDIPLDGYGIRYKYGLFKQQIQNGFQVETADDWLKFGDPWSIRQEEDAQEVQFADERVKAVPYDIPIIGYDTKNINTLRLWQSEALQEFDFTKLNRQDGAAALREKDSAENISQVLYPNDSTLAGKILRLKQQYFFCSASLQDILKRFKEMHAENFENFPAHCAIQINDTHPAVAIPELIRLLCSHGLPFEDAFLIAQKTFAYTNHTVMSEALETWDTELFQKVLPNILDIIKRIDQRLAKEFPDTTCPRIVQKGKIHMASLAVYASDFTNGVAKLHTQILKNDVLKEWYDLFPKRFQNKTNGITQRRWLGLCNPELSSLLNDYIGRAWLKDLSLLRDFKKYAKDQEVIERFNEIKLTKKQQLSRYIEKRENIALSPQFIFDVQVKRLHEYKRQLMNAFSILAIYFRLKAGTLPNFTPTVFIFGAKAAPGYTRAKAIIKYICSVAELINNDPAVNERMRAVFLCEYNCSYAEKIVGAADISEQISTAGTEASGTSNMKFMLNGAVTLGTYDGANIEIVDQAGAENNYIFGARVKELKEIESSYDPKIIYESDPEISRVIDTLVDGTFGRGLQAETSGLKELHASLLEGSPHQRPDHYFILKDLPSYIETKLRANKDYQDRAAFGQKCLINIASAGPFSSDRTIQQYAKEIWKLP